MNSKLLTLTCALALSACTPAPEAEAPATPPLELAWEPILTDLAVEAIALTPAWMHDDLAISLQGLDEDLQNEYALLIVDEDEPWLVDEIGFVIAHTSPEVLTSTNFHPSLITLNAEYDSNLYVVTDCTDIDGSCVGGDEEMGTGAPEQVTVDMSAGEGQLDPIVSRIRLQCVDQIGDGVGGAQAEQRGLILGRHDEQALGFVGRHGEGSFRGRLRLLQVGEGAIEEQSAVRAGLGPAGPLGVVRGVDESLGVRHEAHHAAGRVADARDILGAAVRVAVSGAALAGGLSGSVHVTQRDLVVGFEAIQHTVPRDELALTVSDGQIEALAFGKEHAFVAIGPKANPTVDEHGRIVPG